MHIMYVPPIQLDTFHYASGTDPDLANNHLLPRNWEFGNERDSIVQMSFNLIHSSLISSSTT